MAGAGRGVAGLRGFASIRAATGLVAALSFLVALEGCVEPYDRLTNNSGRRIVLRHDPGTTSERSVALEPGEATEVWTRPRPASFVVSSGACRYAYWIDQRDLTKQWNRLRSATPGLQGAEKLTGFGVLRISVDPDFLLTVKMKYYQEGPFTGDDFAIRLPPRTVECAP